MKILPTRLYSLEAHAKHKNNATRAFYPLMNLTLENRLLAARYLSFSFVCQRLRARAVASLATNQINFITFVFCFLPQQRQSLLVASFLSPSFPAYFSSVCFSSCLVFFSLPFARSLGSISVSVLHHKALGAFSVQCFILPLLA